MPPSFERGRKPDVDDREKAVLGHKPGAERKHIGIVVGPRQAGAFPVAAEGASDTAHAVGYHGFAVAGRSQHDAPLAFAGRHSPGGAVAICCSVNNIITASEQVLRGIWPFQVFEFVAPMRVSCIPAISLWLPRLLGL